MAEEKKRARRWKIVLNLVTIVALLLLIYFVRDQVADTISRLGDVRLWAILLMVPAQAANFYSYALMYEDMLRFLGNKIERLKLFRITLELNFVNNVFPSGGVSGFSFFSARLKPLDVVTGKSTLIQLMRFVLIFISYQAILVFGLLALTFSGGVNNFVLLVAGSLATLMVVGTLFVAYIIGSKSRISKFFTSVTKVVNKGISFFRNNVSETIEVHRVEKVFIDLHENYLLIKKDYSKLKKPLLHAFFANLTEVLTLYVVFIAFGYWVNPGAVILAYAVANFAGLISVLPGGVGIYEAIMTAVLASAGVPAGVSLPVVIMYRVITMVLQLPLGYILYQKALSDNDLRV